MIIYSEDFQGAFGGSFLNLFWLIAANTPEYKNAPDFIRAKNIEYPESFQDGTVTQDGYAVNTLYPEWPGPIKAGNPQTLPPQDMPTIGDRLTAKSISWKWYSPGWDKALVDPVRAAKDKNIQFQFHHHPFAYFKSCKKGTRCFASNLTDATNFKRDIENESLPTVVFYKPDGVHNQHPGYSSLDEGDGEILNIIKSIQKSPLWQKSIIIITYDENGGFWDHVSPPKVDRWGPGTRIPAIIVSPYARKKTVDHTVYDTTSILKLIETRYNLKPLTERDKNANNLLNALEF